MGCNCSNPPQQNVFQPSMEDVEEIIVTFPDVQIEDLFTKKQSDPKLEISGLQSLLLITYAMQKGALLDDYHGKSAVVFLGNTNRGKTEAIKFMSNIKSDVLNTRPQLNREASIMFPTPSKNPQKELQLIDIPQFSGNKAPEFNLANACLTANLLNALSNVKFVVCLTFSSLTARGKGLYDMINVLEEICRCKGNFAKLRSCITFVIIGAPEDHSATEKIKSIFKQVLSNVFSDQDLASTFCSHLITDSQMESLPKLIDSCENLVQCQFYPVLEPFVNQFIISLQQLLKCDLERGISESSYGTICKTLRLVLGLVKKFDRDSPIQFLLKDSLLEVVTSHFYCLKQGFYTACLPGDHFSKESANEYLEKLTSFHGGLSDLMIEIPDGKDGDQSKLNEAAKVSILGNEFNKDDFRHHLIDSVALNNSFQTNRSQDEDEVIKVLITISKKVESGANSSDMPMSMAPKQGSSAVSFEKEVEDAMKQAQDLIKKIKDETKRDKYNKRLEQYKESFKNRRGAIPTFTSQKMKVQLNFFKKSRKEEHVEQACQNTDEFQTLRSDLESLSEEASISHRSELLRRSIQVGQKFAEKAKGKQLIVVLGNTGMGKSTLINLLCGKRIVLNDNGYEVAKGDTMLTKISHGCISETFLPELIDDPQGNTDIVFCDCPGFFDTRGLEINIGNGVSMSSIFQRAKNLKIILLMSYFTLVAEKEQDNKEAMEMLNCCTQLFGSKEQFTCNIGSILLGINHVPEGCDVQTLTNQSSNELLKLLSQQVFVNDPVKENIKGEIEQRLEELKWIETSDLHCKVTLTAIDIQRLVQVMSYLVQEFRKHMHDNQYSSALVPLQNLDAVFNLLNHEQAKDLGNQLKDIVKTEISPVREQIDAGYVSGSFQKSEELVILLKKILELTDKEEWAKQLQRHRKLKEDFEMRQYQNKLFQESEDIENMKKSCEGEKKSLVEFFYFTNGSAWTESLNWICSDEIRNWKGVTTNDKGYVQAIKLPKNNLNGTLPDIFGGLKDLEELDLSGNNLYGELPDSLLQLQKLRSVKLDNNHQLSGTVSGDSAKAYSYKGTQINKKGNLCLEFSSFPFIVVDKDQLLKEDVFIDHEHANAQKGMLFTLVPKKQFCEWTLRGKYDKTGQEIQTTVTRNEIMFLSHRWRGKNHPDCANNSKMHQLKELLSQKRFQEVKYIWMDYLCVPQSKKNKGKQMRAINSLPHYVKCCNHFVVMACDQEVHSKGTFEVYQTRGWCRLERLCAMVPVIDDSGHEVETNAFLHVIDSNRTSTVTKLQVEEIQEPSTINPLHGSFHDKADKWRILQMNPVTNDAIQNISSNDNLKAISTEITQSIEKFVQDELKRLEKYYAIVQLAEAEVKSNY
mmetsp:Transcript_6635/g.8980  ORF Transcript_6635/g.8980 Transcript_6635/m.8980 type:complete len:1367 (+) Transcript_6635:367-4467(+)